MARAATWLALAGGVVLLALVGFTVADAVLRYWFSRPIHGSFDVTQAMLALIVASSIAYGGVSGAHVSLDLLPRPPRAAAFVVRAAGVAVLAVLAWRCVASGLSAAGFGEVSPLLRIPYLPLYFALALGVAGYAVVLALAREADTR
ncbi:MAG: TRAP transporter small permease [Betaproteobacteria bacterium]